MKQVDEAGRIALQVATLVDSPDLLTRLGWSTPSLGEGHPGIALLFAQLGRADSSMRSRAHAHLDAAAARLGGKPGVGLYYGMAALGFVALIAATTPADYGRLLAEVDRCVVAGACQLVQIERERLEARVPGTWARAYDVIVGLSGLGRYLLARVGASSEISDTVSKVLRYLVRLTDPVAVRGHAVPGWWLAGTPNQRQAAANPDGHFDLGIAHGIAGPLALLALTWRDGIIVPGQEQAMHRIAEWLLNWQLSDEGGLYWPTVVGLNEEVTGQIRPDHTSRPGAWCYGTLGIARALQLAAYALGKPAWEQAALTAMHDLFRRAHGQWKISDAGICHGFAGILRTTWRIARESGDAELAKHIPGLVVEVIRGFDRQPVFGFRYEVVGGPVDRPGFLNGAAGTALALIDYSRPAVDGHLLSWDAALLLS
jgi:hypothetical protein